MSTHNCTSCAFSIGALRSRLEDPFQIIPLVEGGVSEIVLWTPEQTGPTLIGGFAVSPVAPCDYTFSYGNRDLVREDSHGILHQAFELLRDALWTTRLLFQFVKLGTRVITLPDLSRVMRGGDLFDLEEAGDLKLTLHPNSYNITALDEANIPWVVRRVKGEPNIIQVG